MSTATLSVEAPPTVSEPIQGEPGVLDRLFRLSVDQYQRMAEIGILGPDDRVELLEGLLVTKMGKNPPHILAANKSLYILIAAVPAGWYVSVENPFLARDSVPEPDFSIIRGRPQDYADRLPNPGEVALLVEVADSSLAGDLKVKKRIYAAAAIPFYWVVNIPNHRLEVFSEPTGQGDDAGYRSHIILGPDDSVPLTIEGQEVAHLVVRDMLP